MHATKIYLERRQLIRQCSLGQQFGNLGNANGTVVVQTCFLGIGEVLLAAVFYPFLGNSHIAKACGTNSACRVSCAASLCARSIIAQKAARNFLLEV